MPACASMTDGESVPLRSLQSRAGRLHDGGPFRDLGLDIGVKLLGRAADDIDAQVAKRLAHSSVAKGRDRGAMQRRDHILGRARRRDQTVPSGGIEALEAK